MFAKCVARFLLVLLSAAAALGGLELWARSAWVAPWHEQLLGDQGRNQRLDYTVNRYGLRDRDYPPKTDDRLRLLIIGDSFTHGTGVPEDELVFPELLERELNRLAWPGKTGVDVLNGGISGSVPRQWVKLWDQVADDFQPDAVLIVFFLRDGTKFGSMDYFEEVLHEVSLPNQASTLYQRSYLYRSMQDLRVKRGFLKRYQGGFHEAYFGTKRQTRLWRRAQEHMDTIIAGAKQRGAAFAMATFPILVELNDDYPFQAVVDEIDRYGRATGFPTLDLLPAFLGMDATQLWVAPADQHPNALGHAIAADALLPFTIELLRDAK